LAAIGRLCAALVLVGLASGCSSPASGQPSGGSDDPLTGADLSVASAAQAAEVRDRTVTTEEYQAAFGRFRNCLSAAGFELVDVELRDDQYEFALPDAAMQDGVDMECYRAEYYFVDILWQLSDADGNGA
jgi:hypothetical protein